MFFFLSKVLSFFTTPMLIICSCLLLSVILRPGRWKKNLFRAGMIMLFFFSNGFIVNEVLHLWEIPVTPFSTIDRKYDYGILLTGVTRTETLPRDRVYFQRGADRVTHTLQLYRTGIIKKIFITGGSGKLLDSSIREADEMKSVLILMGVPDSVLVVEDESRNTRENAVNTVKMLNGLTRPSGCLLISSSYHLRRARACFAKLNWPMDMFSTDFLTYERNFSLEALLVPRAEALVNWNILIKEWIGYAAYWIAGYL